MKRVLVTGGAGFIGSNFCNINKNKYEIIALDNLFLGDEKNLDSDIKFIKGDARKKEDLDKPDLLITSFICSVSNIYISKDEISFELILTVQFSNILLIPFNRVDRII